MLIAELAAGMSLDGFEETSQAHPELELAQRLRR
jgi:hypothetical protein